MSILNNGISHTMIDGAAYKEEVESKDIMAVPTVYLNGEEFGSGRMTIEEILNKLGSGPDAASLLIKILTMYLLLVAVRLVQVPRFMQRVKVFARVL